MPVTFWISQILHIIKNITRQDGKQMENKIKIKYLRIVAKVSIIVIIVFMLSELFQFQENKEMSILQSQLDYYFNEDWTMVFLEDTNLSDKELKNHNRIEELVRNSVAKKVILPYSEKNKNTTLFVFF